MGVREDRKDNQWVNKSLVSKNKYGGGGVLKQQTKFKNDQPILKQVFNQIKSKLTNVFIL